MNISQQSPLGCGLQGLRMPRLVDKTGLSRSLIYQLIKERKFPPPYKLSERVSVWSEQEVSAWMTEKFLR